MKKINFKNMIIAATVSTTLLLTAVMVRMDINYKSEINSINSNLEKQVQHNKELEKEVDRLTTENTTFSEDLHFMKEEMLMLNAEIDRLNKKMNE